MSLSGEELNPFRPPSSTSQKKPAPLFPYVLVVISLFIAYSIPTIYATLILLWFCVFRDDPRNWQWLTFVIALPLAAMVAAMHGWQIKKRADGTRGPIKAFVLALIVIAMELLCLLSLGAP